MEEAGSNVLEMETELLAIEILGDETRPNLVHYHVRKFLKPGKVRHQIA